ncbi:multicopper oxidase-domain-containing protein [Mycena capillaripes]|nr:multicopper oxidase-domain-containing protein [Mycena capillaripes]
MIAPDGKFTTIVIRPISPAHPGLFSPGNGERFLINVQDWLTNNTMLTDTSIHWHGLFQKGKNWADGPAWVTQCPITPGHSFLYDFEVPNQAGTFWYHSHLCPPLNFCDGLRGPMVAHADMLMVYDPHDPAMHLYESTIITLADWYHFPATQAPTSGPPMFNSTLINGLGRYPEGTVSPGKRYRFRLVSISCDPNFIFRCVDGVNHQQLTVDSIQILAGQRYSFVLTANQPASNYWIRAEPNSNQGFFNATNSAILRYVWAPKSDPTTSSETKQPLVETSLHPLVPSRVPGHHMPGRADINLRLEITLNTSTTLARWQLNDTVFCQRCLEIIAEVNSQTFDPPSVPVLLQILSGKHKAQELLPKNNLYELRPNNVVEISIPGGVNGAPHPFHLHGHNFYVVRSSGNSTYNWDNPVAVSVVFAENIPAIAHENPPIAWDNLCPIYNHTHGL